MYRAKSDLEVKSRLYDMVRRSAELTANSSKLADMALELDILRRVNGKAGLSLDGGKPHANEEATDRRFHGHGRL
jgi:hypothetical protein